MKAPPANCFLARSDLAGRSGTGTKRFNCRALGIVRTTTCGCDRRAVRADSAAGSELAGELASLDEEADAATLPKDRYLATRLVLMPIELRHQPDASCTPSSSASLHLRASWMVRTHRQAPLRTMNPPQGVLPLRETKTLARLQLQPAQQGPPHYKRARPPSHHHPLPFPPPLRQTACSM